jgi:hypothetical protein
MPCPMAWIMRHALRRGLTVFRTNGLPFKMTARSLGTVSLVKETALPQT